MQSSLNTFAVQNNRKSADRELKKLLIEPDLGLELSCPCPQEGLSSKSQPLARASNPR